MLRERSGGLRGFRAQSFLALIVSSAFAPSASASLGRNYGETPSSAILGLSGGQVDGHAVSESSGAARLQIPIDVPPGPGLEPKLALTYSSQAGDGPFGVGWDLHLGEIRCSIRFGVPNYGACPQYELDGQLLVPEEPPNDRYHTFVESFQRISRQPPQNQWEVVLPDGTQLYYGATTDARIHVDDDPLQPVARWLLSRMRDPFGNEIAISYDDSGVGVAYPSQISYASGQRRVDFLYDARPDPIYDFAGGLERHLTKRLREIRVTSNGEVFSRLVLGYAAAGTYLTGRSRLAWVQRFGTDCDATIADPLSGCTGLPPRTFTYTDALASAVDSTGTPPATQWGGPSTPWPTSPTPTSSKGFQYGDIDGDGLPDLVQAWCPETEYPCADSSSGTRRVYLNTGAGWVLSETWTAALEALSYDAPTATIRWFVDHPPGTAQTLIRICDLDPGTQTRRIVFEDERNEIKPIAVDTFEPRPVWRLVDLNGDGRADLVSAVRVSAERTVDCSGNQVGWSSSGYEYLLGETRQVYINNGEGWDPDPLLAASLPLFEEMSLVRSSGSGSYSGPWNSNEGTCASIGLWETEYAFPSGRYCVSWIEFQPRFVELNGDGLLDVVVVQPADRLIPYDPEEPPAYHFWMNFYNPLGKKRGYLGSGWGNGGFSWAWIQGSDGWTRAPQFDLPVQHMHYNYFVGYMSMDGGGLRMLDPGVRFADLNRDGLTDVLFDAWGLTAQEGDPPPNPAGVLLNTGTGWCSGTGTEAPPCGVDLSRYLLPPGVRFTTWDWYPLWEYPTEPIAPASTTHGDLLVDVNGDAWVDLVSAWGTWLHDPSAPGGSVWVQDAGFSSLTPPCTSCALFMDRDGNGTIDTSTRLAQGTFSDLIEEDDNGRGGLVRFSYDAAIFQQQTDLEARAELDANGPNGNDGKEPLLAGGPDITRWTRTPVVTEVTVEGPNRAPATTGYAYAHPRWSTETRSQLGFRLVEQTRPDGSVVEHFYYQQHGRAGRLSEEIVWDPGGSPLHRTLDVWDAVPDPTTVTGAIEGVKVGRLKSRTTHAEYGASLGESVGATRTTTFTYHDSHGYNFVSQIREARPTGTLDTIRVPKPANTDAWLVRLVQERRQEEPGSPPTVLSRATFTYTPEGEVSSVTRDVKERGSGDPPTQAVTQWFYDDWGNLTKIIDANQGETDLCYDGDNLTVAWCPSTPGPATHSVLAGILDPLGKKIVLTPDPVLGMAAAIVSEYLDEPTVRRTFDPFGRIEREYVTPEGGAELLFSRTIYDDDALPAPLRETRLYVDGIEAGEFVRTAVVEDGFGGPWKTIEETPSGYRGIAVYRDPGSPMSPPVVRETYPISCGADPVCGALTGQSDAPAVVEASDALGRPIRIDTPDGIALLAFGSGTQPAGPGQGSVLDRVLEKNAKGDLTQRFLDGQRVVWVDECKNAVAPGLTDLKAVICSNPDRTFYRYEASGEISTIYDAVAVATPDFDDPSHYLRYTYDTLARIVRIADPDAGTTVTGYDAVGNVTSTRNARGQDVFYAYDALDRLTSITRPTTGEKDYSITYDSVSPRRQPVGMTIEGFWPDTLSFEYDGLGRVQRRTQTFGGLSFLLDFEYDVLGRVTKILYPTQSGHVSYQYEGAYLKAVCGSGDPAACDPAQGGDPAQYFISDIQYDDLGREQTRTLPPGTLTHAHYGLADDPAAGRLVYGLKQRWFTAAGAAVNDLDLGYDYDPIGNVTAIADAHPDTGDGISAEASYEYDVRGRLTKRTIDGVTKHFSYDALGNLVGRDLATAGGANQTYDPAKPHRLQMSHTGKVYEYDADGNAARRGSDYLKYDSTGRLVCVGSSQGACDIAEFGYDPFGNRVWEKTAAGWRHLVGDFFEYESRPEDATVHVLAFGQRIASQQKHSLLRGAGAPGAWEWPLAPEPFAWGLASGAGLLLLLGLARMGALEGARARPVPAVVAGVLVLSLLAPPHATGGGGGGPQWVRRWFFHDQLGSAVLATNATGDVTLRRVFEPFGMVLAESSTESPPLFTGQRFEGASALYDFRARWYDPEAGRFLSVDPLVVAADPQSHNGYGYANNNPVNLVDVGGRIPEPPKNAQERRERWEQRVGPWADAPMYDSFAYRMMVRLEARELAQRPAKIERLLKELRLLQAALLLAEGDILPPVGALKPFNVEELLKEVVIELITNATSERLPELIAQREQALKSLGVPQSRICALYCISLKPESEEEDEEGTSKRIELEVEPDPPSEEPEEPAESDRSSEAPGLTIGGGPGPRFSTSGRISWPPVLRSPRPR